MHHLTHKSSNSTVNHQTLFCFSGGSDFSFSLCNFFKCFLFCFFVFFGEFFNIIVGFRWGGGLPLLASIQFPEES
ncbi:hypothetical protein CISIN_1g035072mg [Citrus sinensis]|uniref:Uncharacterized protein n=1 Tax=Citrus sinensis TaxID=2711 RepID=A0A067G684_CITSI|nr:hypothetical protein CISIN_1g035072mg [Citrus sinensis]